MATQHMRNTKSVITHIVVDYTHQTLISTRELWHRMEGKLQLLIIKKNRRKEIYYTNI